MKGVPRLVGLLLLLISGLLVSTCAPDQPTGPAYTPDLLRIRSPSDTVLFIGAGDIAGCPSGYKDEATAAILAKFPSALVFAAGDLAYPERQQRPTSPAITHPGAGQKAAPIRCRETGITTRLTPGATSIIGTGRGWIRGGPGIGPEATTPSITAHGASTRSIARPASPPRPRGSRRTSRHILDGASSPSCTCRTTPPLGSAR